MKYVYPAIFSPEIDGGYSIHFPDIRCGASQAESIEECIDMAQDFLCLALYNMEKDSSFIPHPSDIREISSNKNDIVTLISVDTDAYHRFYDNKLIKKTLNIPSWLNEQAEAANINFSQTLQKALKEELHSMVGEEYKKYY